MTSTPYRLALLFITLVPMPFAFIGRPLIIILTYTIVGSLFVPFLAATLLYLNNFRFPPDERRAEELAADEYRARVRAGPVRSRRRLRGGVTSMTAESVLAKPPQSLNRLIAQSLNGAIG